MRLFVDKLTNLDFSYLDKQRGLVGETWLANIELEGALDEQGMVVDFGTVKKTIRTWLDDNIDHKLLVPGLADDIDVRSSGNDDIIRWSMNDKSEISTQAPASAHCIIPCTHIRPESVANWCIEQLIPHFPSSVNTLHLSFSHEAISDPFYHYTHGLKKHLGNCQRIAHGHRSRIEIWENGKLSQNKMQYIADKWKDIYIGTTEDCADDIQTNGNYAFQYQAQQGQFRLSIPKERCYLMHSETTVELIADHIADTLKRENPDSNFIVRAFEGLNKGAIAER